MTVDEQQDKWTYKDPNSGCWLWLGAANKDGYAKSENSAYPGETLGHRLSYLYHVGSIPDNKEIDHVCRVRCCVNPSHLEAILHVENVRIGENYWRKKTHCINGHEFTQTNARFVVSAGRKRRICKQCDAKRQFNYQHKQDHEHAKTR
jgi:hypothetical protein